MIITPYESFKFNNSLAGSVYPTSPQPDEDEPPIATQIEAKQRLASTITERGKFHYSFAEYQITWLLRSLCCCLFRKDSLWWKIRNFKYERYEEAVSKLEVEIDVLKFLSN